jgi:chromate reductase
VKVSPKILAFAGSSRAGSLNSKLLLAACESARASGAEVTMVDLRDLPMPLYDGDLERSNGVPDNAHKLRYLMVSHQAQLIACPEYNGSVPAVLKNALDWCSRPADGQAGLVAFRGKVVSLMAASIGPFGGIRALGHLRAIMSKMGAVVLPEDCAVPFADRAFTPKGAIVDDNLRALLARNVSDTVEAIRSAQLAEAG